MAYVTSAQLQERWPSLLFWSDDSGSGAIDNDVVGSVIAASDARIDRAASQNYVTPLALQDGQTASYVRGMAEILCGYMLAERTHDMIAIEAMRASYDDTIRFLDRLARGDEALYGETPRARDLPGGKVVVGGDQSTITNSNMWGL